MVRGVPVEQSRPLEFKQAIRGFQDGKTFKQIHDKTGISKTTLQRIKADHKELIAEKQDRALDKMLDVREMALSRMEQEINDIKLESLPVAIGILSDKVRDMTGGSVSTVAHISVKLPEDVKENTVIDLLPTANPCEPDSGQEETPGITEVDNGLPNQSAAADAADQGDDQGAGGVEPDLGGEPGTHTAGEKFLSNWKPGGEG